MMHTRVSWSPLQPRSVGCLRRSCSLFSRENCLYAFCSCFPAAPSLAFFLSFFIFLSCSCNILISYMPYSFSYRIILSSRSRCYHEILHLSSPIRSFSFPFEILFRPVAYVRSFTFVHLFTLISFFCSFFLYLFRTFFFSLFYTLIISFSVFLFLFPMSIVLCVLSLSLSLARSFVLSRFLPGLTRASPCFSAVTRSGPTSSNPQ